MDDVEKLIPEVQSKRCKTCGEMLSLTEYHKSPTVKDKHFHICKKCYSIHRKEYRKNNPLSEDKKREHREKGRIWYQNNKEHKAEYTKLRRQNYPQIQRNIEYKNKYGITLSEYDTILKEQDGACAICKIPQSNLDYFLAVDHNHTTGKVRGLLCRNCNLAIGYFKDDVELIKKSIHYLERFKEDVNV